MPESEMKLPLITFFLFLFVACKGKINDARPPQNDHSGVKTEKLALVDNTRHRAVPVVLYYNPARDGQKAKQKVAVLNHGYGGTHTDYSFIAAHLVSHGYLVISIQHDLAGDAPLATKGNLYAARMPVWKRGVQSMQFAIAEIRKLKPYLDFKNLLLIGHSNGGDMAVLFAHEYPEQVENLISLDNRRMPLPRTRKPRILSLRSRDQPADAGVLPTPEEQQQFGITIIRLSDTTHNDMYDGATDAQKKEILGCISEFLRG